MSGATPVDVYDLIDRYQLDVVSSILMGKATRSVITGKQPFREAMDTLLRINGFRQLLGYLPPFPVFKNVSLIFARNIGALTPIQLLCPRAVRRLDEYLEECVDHTLQRSIEYIEQKPSPSENLVESLAVQHLSRKAIKDQLIAVLLAAKDPTSIVITWALYELAKNNKVYEDLRKEALTM